MSRKELSREELDQLVLVAALPEERIDLIDIPEAPAENWKDARRGKPRLTERPVDVAVDADIVAWFRDHAPGDAYQAEINRVLRRHVERAGEPRA